MPSFVSKNGVWEPAKEYAVDPKAEPGKEIYEGPDRAALAMIAESGEDHLGMDFKLDPEMVMRAKQFGFDSVEEYIAAKGYDPKKAEADYKKKVEQVNRHRPVEPKKFPKIKGGGTDTSGGGKDRYGDYSHPDDAPASMSKPNTALQAQGAK